MSIELSKIKLVLPKGCTISKEAAADPADDHVVKVEVTFGAEPVKGVIGVFYEGDYGSASVESIKYPKLLEWGLKDTKGFIAGMLGTTLAKFDSEIDMNLVSFEFPQGWIFKNKQLGADKKSIHVTFMTPDEVRTADKLILNYKGEKHEYVVKVDKPKNTFLGLQAQAEVYPKGKEFEVEFMYAYPVGEADKPTDITCSDGLKLVSNEPSSIQGTKMYYRFVGETAGEKTITATAYLGIPGQQIGRMMKIRISE